MTIGLQVSSRQPRAPEKYTFVSYWKKLQQIQQAVSGFAINLEHLPSIKWGGFCSQQQLTSELEEYAPRFAAEMRAEVRSATGGRLTISAGDVNKQYADLKRTLQGINHFLIARQVALGEQAYQTSADTERHSRGAMELQPRSKLPENPGDFLPVELWVRVFECLPLADQLRCRTVCKFWQDPADDARVTERMVLYRNPATRNSLLLSLVILLEQGKFVRVKDLYQCNTKVSERMGAKWFKPNSHQEGEALDLAWDKAATPDVAPGKGCVIA